VKIDAYKSETSKKGDEKITRIQINKDDHLHLLNVVEEDKYKILMDFSFMVYKDFVATGFYTQSYSTFSSQLNDTTTKLYLRYFFEKLEDHWHVLAEWPKIKVLLDGDNFAKSNLKEVTLGKDKLHPKLRILTNDKFITMKTTFVDEEGHEVIGINDDIRIFQGRIILSEDRLYLHNKMELNILLETMPNGSLNFPLAHKQHVIKEILYPLSKKYNVEIPESLSMAVIEAEMIPCIHLREFENKFLMISPKFLYDDLSIEMMDTRNFTIGDATGNEAMLIRQKDEEDAFVEYIRTLHPQFRLQTYSPYFTLPFEDVMKHQWFINFSQQLLADNIKVIGFSDLKRFKYNTSTPTWDMKVSSGIDWFDIKIIAAWGDQEMSFRDIRKAILNGQDFVVLGDGSFGMMPEEWIKKYSNLFKFGVDDKEGLKVSKKHFNIIDVLFDQIDDEAILAEIEDKKQKLLNIENINPQPIPSDIQATLRPYQEAGYQWMQVLDEISWGGCLADDMGLGKTLQAITFLSFLKKKYNRPTSLIVCPTSLIYNWENELKKFAPDLTYHLFYGVDREFSQDHFNDYDIIISSYGIVRNDIEALVKYEWEYIILDESQAIKNPDAMSTKAVQLLKARNKFILSGTPLQNNTFDIYAQFNFLNPGLLGSKDFFRTQFANPIDKLGDKSASLFLRNLIKPFMLRRTKTEVAPDLPEKTEVILWCQMGKAQKAIYDEYKDYYRHALMQKIDTDGMAKAGVYILEGLLRLRQICDDPRLIKDKDIKPVKGIKIEELFRELDENMGDHKMLVFSQFTEMLALIREELDQKKISYCYLDGSTPAIQRQEQVDLFQNSKDINIFLISLKAGGVGLNLTEADYVYIVDPWWNPAVEQQAIDRTHRIGQKNKIFAYKMICKESVEEKIILLQEKKKSISQEIVQEDTAFFKSLTKDDISFLFS
ncbi:MAG: SNF2-related protein, partial [Saprospiraceae bacterium]